MINSNKIKFCPEKLGITLGAIKEETSEEIK